MKKFDSILYTVEIVEYTFLYIIIKIIIVFCRKKKFFEKKKKNLIKYLIYHDKIL